VKILVIGGAGCLGSELCRRAVAAGHDVVAVRMRRKPPHGRPVRADLRDDDEVQRVLMKHGPELVVHTAYREAGEALEDDVVRASRNVALASDAAAVHPRALVVRTSLLYGSPGGAQERLAARGGEFYVDELRCPTHVGDLAAALLELGGRDDLAGLCTSPPPRRPRGSSSPSSSARPRRGACRARASAARATSASTPPAPRGSCGPGCAASRRSAAERRRCYTSLTTFHRFGEMGLRAHFL
jgi:dTDP-4-dehydrorhamnose reductase